VAVMAKLIDFCINLGMINCELRVLIGGTIKEANKVLEKHFKDDDLLIDGDCNGIFLWSEQDVPVMWLKRRPRTAREIASLAHEANHATHYFMRYIGTPVTEDSEEILCYTLDHIVEQVLLKVRG
jgi:hypothetical protein